MEIEWVKQGIDFTRNNQALIVLTVGVIAVIGIYSLPFYLAGKSEWLDRVTPKRRGKMLRRDRRIYVEKMMLDVFVDDVETQVYNEVLSRAEAKEIYLKLKRVFNTSRDLFPSPRLLKDNIRKRLQSGVHAPVDLPKIDKPPVVKRKHMFDKSANTDVSKSTKAA